MHLIFIIFLIRIPWNYIQMLYGCGGCSREKLAPLSSSRHSHPPRNPIRRCGEYFADLVHSPNSPLVVV
jgi:hypothetical protein